MIRCITLVDPEPSCADRGVFVPSYGDASCPPGYYTSRVGMRSFWVGYRNDWESMLAKCEKEGLCPDLAGRLRRLPCSVEKQDRRRLSTILSAAGCWSAAGGIRQRLMHILESAGDGMVVFVDRRHPGLSDRR